MNKLVLFALLLSPAASLACIDQWSPDNWVLNPQEDIPIVGFATSTEGSRFIDLSIQEDGKAIANFTLERPKNWHTWLFNVCQDSRRNDPLLFAVAHVPKGEYGPFWTSKLTAAYRINLKSKRLEAVDLKGIRCFVAH